MSAILKFVVNERGSIVHSPARVVANPSDGTALRNLSPKDKHGEAPRRALCVIRDGANAGQSGRPYRARTWRQLPARRRDHPCCGSLIDESREEEPEALGTGEARTSRGGAGQIPVPMWISGGFRRVGLKTLIINSLNEIQSISDVFSIRWEDFPGIEIFGDSRFIMFRLGGVWPEGFVRMRHLPIAKNWLSGESTGLSDISACGWGDGFEVD